MKLIFGPDGESHVAHQAGNMIISDGEAYVSVGNAAFGTDGSSYFKAGNVLFGNNGDSHLIFGDDPMFLV